MILPELETKAARIRQAAVNGAVGVGYLSVILSYLQARPTVDVLMIAIVSALSGLGPWWVYHYRSRRDDGLVIVMIGALPTIRGWGFSTGAIMVSLAVFSVVYLLMAYLTGNAFATTSKPTKPIARPLEDPEIDSRLAI